MPSSLSHAVELEDASPEELANLTTHTAALPEDKSTGRHRKSEQKSLRRGIAMGVLLSLAVVLCLYTASQRPSLMSTKGLKSTTETLSLGAVEERQDNSSVEEISPSPVSKGYPLSTQAFHTSEPHQQSTPLESGVIKVKSLLVQSSRSIGGCGGTASSSPQGGVHPACPVFKRIDPTSPQSSPIEGGTTDRDTEVDRSPEWVNKKYTLYASQCAAKQGMMWSKLRRSTHDAMLRRVLSLAVQQDALSLEVGGSSSLSLSNATTITLELPRAELQQSLVRYAQSTKGGSSKVLRVLDWGCGCGVGVDAISRLLLTDPREGRDSSDAPLTQNSKFIMRPEIMGIDVTKSAITHANEMVRKRGGEDNPLASTVQFCHADGTSLSWIPSDSYDIVLAFGSLLHLPVDAMCETVSELLRIVRVGGIVWGGYIDSKDTATRLAQCNIITPTTCSFPFGATVSMLKENTWFKRLGVPSANKKRKPASLVWRKVAATPTN